MSISRRRFLKTLVVTAGTLSISVPLVLRAAPADRRSERLFPQSVASGDPKPNSVVLWTRLADERLVQGFASLPLRLQVATSKRFDNLILDVDLEAHAEDDGCVRVKVTGLMPRTFYFYRFIGYEAGADEAVVSRHGRTRAAPAADDEVPIRFALASCQDYIGKYYNAYLPLLERENDELDFLLHVGDFIYETSGDPSFQGQGGERSLVFDDEDGAIKFRDAEGEVTFEAARSLGNYRQLYRTYRSDEVLQAVLERFPLIHIWDDHELTDDSWRDHSTYFNGLGTLPDGPSIRKGDGTENPEEQDLERRLNAEQAFLEYMPIDDEDLTLSAPQAADAIAVRDILDKREGKLYPGFRFFRDLHFGKLCNLVLPDYRTYRPNHPVDEDAFPGTLLYGEDAIRAKYDQLFGAAGQERFDNDRRLFAFSSALPRRVVVDLENGNPSGLREYAPWADLSGEQQAALRAQLSAEYAELGFDPTVAQDKAWGVLQGDLDIEYLNRIIGAHNSASGGDVTKIARNVEKSPYAPQNRYGLTNYCLHKITPIDDLGARYALNPQWYELWRALRADETGGRPPEEDAYGEDLVATGQETWLKGAIEASEATWNIVASSVSSSSIVIDLENEAQLPPDGSLPDSGPGGENAQVEALRRLLALVLKVLGLGTRFYITCDQWDGMPNKRYALHRLYREKGNVVLVSGDIHSSWINDFSTPEEGNLFEFTGTSISSATFSGVLSALASPSTAALASLGRPTAPFAGFLRAVRRALASGHLTLDPHALDGLLEPARRAELFALAEQAFGVAGDAGDLQSGGLSGLIEQLLAVLDAYFFDLNYKSPYLRTEEGISKVKSTLVGVDSGSNGIVIVAVGPDSVLATYLLVDPADVAQSYYGPRERRRFLHDKVLVRQFQIEGGGLHEL